MARHTILAGVCCLGFAASASARTWDCTVWQWRQSAKLTVGAFSIDPVRSSTKTVAIDNDTTASCRGEPGHRSSVPLLICTVYTASTHYAARGVVSDDSNYLLASGNRTDLLIDNQIECAPAAAQDGL